MKFSQEFLYIFSLSGSVVNPDPVGSKTFRCFGGTLPLFLFIFTSLEQTYNSYIYFS
jgi:hypothetical protein